MAEAFRTIIVSDAYIDLARTITETLAPVGGRGMYSTGLSADGMAPATHWISSGFIDADYAMLLPLSEWQWLDDEAKWDENLISVGDQYAIFDFYTDAIQTPPTEDNPTPDPVDPGFTLADVEALLAASDVTTEEPFTALARLGLQIIHEESI